MQSETIRAPRACAATSACDERGRRRVVRIGPAGDDDRVGALERLEPVRRLDDEAGLRPHAPLAGRDDEELVPGIDDVAAVEPEDLARDREVERQGSLVDDRATVCMAEN